MRRFGFGAVQDCWLLKVVVVVVVVVIVVVVVHTQSGTHIGIHSPGTRRTSTGNVVVIISSTVVARVVRNTARV